jgi:hypothetical protein
MIVVVSFSMTVLGAQVELKPGARIVPIIDGAWWQVAGNPDLGEYTSKKQQPVDFGVWQAADGTWQLWSCIRHTKCGGHTRLFFRWQGRRLTDANWQPMGIAMQADPNVGESPGGLQAPHVVKHAGVYWMAYGDWVNICFATSTDGKSFRRVIQPNGKTGAFSEGPSANTRDAMLIKIDGLWHCYYTAFPGRQGFAFCRTSPDLRRWSRSCVVSYGGKIGTSPFHIECPHVVEVLPGEFVFFRNEFYGRGQRNWAYHSRNPLNFGINDDSRLVCNLPVAAPEIILHEGKYYIAALNPGLDGIRIARLKWAKVGPLGKPVFDFDDANVRAAWRVVEGDLDGIWTTSKRQPFNAVNRHFIGTAETKTGQLSDGRTGVIESPAFVLDSDEYVLLVSGGKNKSNTYVAVVNADDGSELARYCGKDGNALREVRFDTGSHKGKRARIRVVDRAKGDWGHVNFGGIFAAPKPVVFK